MRNLLSPIIKDTSHSCIFDFPDNPFPPLPPPPQPPSDPPNCYPYCPHDDWPPPFPPPPPPDPDVEPPGTITHGTGYYNATCQLLAGLFSQTDLELTINGTLDITTFGQLAMNCDGLTSNLSGSNIGLELYDDHVSDVNYVGRLARAAGGITVFRGWHYLVFNTNNVDFQYFSRIAPEETLVRCRTVINFKQFNPSNYTVVPPEIIDPDLFKIRITFNNNHVPYRVTYLTPANNGQMHQLVAWWFYNRTNGSLGSYVTYDGIQLDPTYG